MVFQVFGAEIMKYRRTFIPWLVVVGGFFPVFVALLFLLTNDIAVSWEILGSMSLNFMNMLALLLVAVFAGHAFTSEYRDSRINQTFIYPVPRFTLYIVKFLIVCLFVLSMFLAFMVFLAAAGCVFAGELPDSHFAGDYMLLLLLTAAADIAIVPVTAAISVAAKNAGSYILAGVAYFITYMSFAESDAGRYIIPCVPDRLLKDFFATGQLISADTGGMLLTGAAVFLLAFCLSAACYTRWEI